MDIAGVSKNGVEIARRSTAKGYRARMLYRSRFLNPVVFLTSWNFRKDYDQSGRSLARLPIGARRAPPIGNVRFFVVGLNIYFDALVHATKIHRWKLSHGISRRFWFFGGLSVSVRDPMLSWQRSDCSSLFGLSVAPRTAS